METFTYKIDSQHEEIVKYPVRTVKLGDGYEQRQALGLGPPLREWECRRTGDKLEIQKIVDFFHRQAGVKAFVWRDGGQAVVKVAEWRRVHLGGRIYRLTWKFEEVRA